MWLSLLPCAWPQNAPHRVSNLDGLNVSLSTEYFTRQSRRRFQVFVAQVGRRLATDHRLVSEVLETIASNNPDLFTTTADDAPLHGRAAGNGNGAHRKVAAEAEPADTEEDIDHG